MIDTFKPPKPGCDPYPKCFDCKWPLASKVAKTCDCLSTNDYSYEKHRAALAEARKLQESGVPIEDERYYI